jgi:hypothetical protein
MKPHANRQLMVAALVIAAGCIAGCEHDSGSSSGVFPKFIDGNANQINDYAESGSHVVSADDPQWHTFVDANGNATCDFAESATPVWHGPGYVDSDGDGVCDYWDSDSSRHHSGRRDIVHGSDFDEVMGPAGPHH